LLHYKKYTKDNPYRQQPLKNLEKDLKYFLQTGAEDVEEDEGAVGGVTAHEVAVGDASQEGEGLKR